MSEGMPQAVSMPKGKWKTYPAYKDSGVEWLGQIPAHWGWKRLKYSVSFFGGGTPSKDNPDYWTGDIPWVSPKDMKEEVLGDTEDHVTRQAVAESATRVVPPQSVLIVVRSGILKHSIPVAINARAVALNQDLKALVPRQFLRPTYLKYLIVGHQGALLFAWRKAGATVESIEHELVANTLCPLPPLDDQQAIAAFLDREMARIDALVAKKERLIELLQEKRAALITHAVTKGLDPTETMKDSGIEWLGKIPAHWNTRRLKFVTTHVTSGSRGWAEHYSDEGPVFLRIGNLQRAGIDLDLEELQRVAPPPGGEGERTKVRGGDLLISITAFIGSIGVVPDDLREGYVNQHLALARPVLEHVESRWLAYCLLSQAGQRQFQTAFYGGTKEGLGLDDVKNLIVLLPCVEEQRSFTAYLDRETAKIDGLVAKVCEGIDRLKEYRSALISAAVTGKIDVREVAA